MVDDLEQNAPGRRSMRGLRAGFAVAACGVVMAPIVMAPIVMGAIVAVPAYARPEPAGRTVAAAAARPVPAAGRMVTVAPERPIEKAWPKAVHKVPRRLPGGGLARPVTMLGAGRLLLTSENRHERANALYVRQLRSGRTVKLADIPLPKGTTLFPSGFTVGHGKIAWWTARGRTADIWAVPEKGGKARRVASAPLPPPSRSGHITGLAVTRKGFAWSAGDWGVFTVPAAGGRPRSITGTKGLHLMRWPWAGSPGPFDPIKAPYQSIKNVETGETRADPASGTAVACGVSRCIARAGDSPAGRVLGRDGRPQGAVNVAGMRPQPLLRDRFAVAQHPDRALIHDLRSKTSVVVKGINTRVGDRTAAGDDFVRFTRADGAYLIVDLASVR
ncbi:hypothetical protein WBK31_11380 [Nonomuraea sp. N2-4H]|jgi:hypothetical protein|uniref:hypothetical protein n=1 Tax=Nonomuraea sp. N2-4H TaxID=3128898 RepID=UPI0032562167